MSTSRRKCRLCGNSRMLNNLKSRLCLQCAPEWQEKFEHKKAIKEKLSAAYQELIQYYPNECMICGKEPITRRLNVDHDHATGLVRGLLCYRCNYGLDWFRDNPELLRAAAKYLERP